MYYLIILVLLFLAELFYFRVADRCNIIDKPNERSSHTKAPPLVSTRAKHPISIINGAMRTNWSTRGWYLPDDCRRPMG